MIKLTLIPRILWRSDKIYEDKSIKSLIHSTAYSQLHDIKSLISHINACLTYQEDSRLLFSLSKSVQSTKYPTCTDRPGYRWLSYLICREIIDGNTAGIPVEIPCSAMTGCGHQTGVCLLVKGREREKDSRWWQYISLAPSSYDP